MMEVRGEMRQKSLSFSFLLCVLYPEPGGVLDVRDDVGLALGGQFWESMLFFLMGLFWLFCFVFSSAV